MNARGNTVSDGPGPPGRLLLFATVALTGGAVMVLELLGTRIIAPFFGVSLYVWSSLIAVTLIALALGYFLGGWCADRVPRLRLAHLLLAAALGTLLIPLLSRPVLEAADALGMRAGTLVASLTLFLAPLTCLGMIGPCVVKLATRELAGVGTAAGSVYAVSTAGSVLGTLGLGFYLLPVLGTRNIILGTGGLLLVLSALHAVRERRALGRAHAAGLAFGAVLGAAALVVAAQREALAAPQFTVLSDEEGMYGWVRVVDDAGRNARLLLSDASTISAVRIDTGETMLDYQEILALLPEIRRSRTSAAQSGALVIGLGGGYVAAQFNNRGLVTDTIEIDPAVARAAREFFAFRPQGRFIVGDGRNEIRRLDQRYRIIVHDCFTGGSEPPHLFTREMFEQLRALLTEDGVLAVNFVGTTRGEGAAALASVARTLLAVFPRLRVYATRPDAEFSDYVLLASQQPVEFEPTDPERRRRIAILRTLERTIASDAGIVLTDDYNPLEHMQARKAEVYRDLFKARVAPQLLLR